MEAKFGTVEPGAITPLGDLYTLDCGGHEEHAGKEHTEEGHEHGICDSHVWMNPHSVMRWTLAVRDVFSGLDPANAEVYAANAAAYLDQLQALDGEIAAQIETIPQANRKLVTNHEAFGYYANRYGLEMIGTVIPAASTLAEPSAVEIARLIDTIKAQGVPAIFADSTANPDLAQQIADETGATFYTLYTGSLSESDGPAATYLDYMRYNTRTIVEALGGTIDG